MPNPNKTVIPGKAQKDNNSNKKFKIKKKDDVPGMPNNEVDIEIEIEDDGDYTVEKLSTDDLDTHLADGTEIKWFNNFAVKKGDSYINQPYKIKVPGISSLRASNRNLVIQDGNSHNGKAYIFTGAITDDTIDFSDGDPAIGVAP